MSNYSALKTTINANIKTNGNQEITGAIMNSVLTQIVDSLGAGYQYMGVATPDTDPGTPDQKVFYLAAEPGVYTNFDGLEIKDGFLGILVWGNAWSVQRVESTALTMFGVNAFDIRSHNTSSAASVEEGTRLSATHAIRKGDVVVAQSSFGAGIVVQVYDSVTYAYIGMTSHMLQAITSGYTTFQVTGEIEQDGYLLIKWAKEDSSAITTEEQEEAISGLNLTIYRGLGVLVKSVVDEMASVNERLGLSVYKAFSLSDIQDNLADAYINATNNVWATSSTVNSFFLPIQPGRRYYIKGFTSAARIAVLTTNEVTIGEKPSYATGYISLLEVAAQGEFSFVAPNDAAYLNVNYTLSSTKIVPSFIMEEMSLPEMALEIKSCVRDVTGCQARFVDARSTSETFGLSVKATNTSWLASDPVLVRGFKKIRYEAVYNSTSSNYYGKAGDVFYDKDLNPLAVNQRLIKQAGVSTIGMIEVEIPENAWYFRHTFTTSNTETTLRLISDSNEGLLEYNESREDKDLNYFGNKIDLGNSYNFEEYANNSMLGQSGAVYGDYLFIVKDELTKVAVYNLRTKQLLYTLTTGITSQSHWHCNQSSFSTKFYAQNDPFPVLYISMQNNQNARGEAHGYRIIPSYTDGEISSFTISLVQTIYLPSMTDENCLGNPNVTFDVKNGYMWAYCRNENSEAENYRKAHFVRFAIPELTSSEVTLEDTDILEQFSDDWSMLYAQGGFIRNGKLVIMQGYPSAGFIYCRVIDLYLTQRMESLIDLYTDGFSQEPEGVFYYNGKIMTACASAYIFQLNL